jgi:hypothetical protein
MSAHSESIDLIFKSFHNRVQLVTQTNENLLENVPAK